MSGDVVLERDIVVGGPDGMAADRALGAVREAGPPLEDGADAVTEAHAGSPSWTSLRSQLVTSPHSLQANRARAPVDVFGSSRPHSVHS